MVGFRTARTRVQQPSVEANPGAPRGSGGMHRFERRVLHAYDKGIAGKLHASHQ